MKRLIPLLFTFTLLASYAFADEPGEPPGHASNNQDDNEMFNIHGMLSVLGGFFHHRENKSDQCP